MVVLSCMALCVARLLVLLSIDYVDGNGNGDDDDKDPDADADADAAMVLPGTQVP